MKTNRNNCKLAALGLSLFLAALPSHAVTAGKGTVGSADAVWQDADDQPAALAAPGAKVAAPKGKRPALARYNYCVLPQVLNDTSDKLSAGSVTVKVNRQGNAAEVGSMTNSKQIDKDGKYAHTDVWCEKGVVGIGPPNMTISVSGPSAQATGGASLQNAITFRPKAAKTVNLRDLLLGVHSGTPTSKPDPKN